MLDESNAATGIGFVTGANSTTRTGTQRMFIGANGGVSVGSTYVGLTQGQGQ